MTDEHRATRHTATLARGLFINAYLDTVRGPGWAREHAERLFDAIAAGAADATDDPAGETPEKALARAQGFFDGYKDGVHDARTGQVPAHVDPELQCIRPEPGARNYPPGQDGPE